MTIDVSPERIAKALRLLNNVEAYNDLRDRVLIARHEAGHAVMALSLGVDVVSASMQLRYELQVDGHVRLTAPAPLDRRAQSADDRWRLERTALVMLAGGAADRLGLTPVAWRCEVDDHTVRELLRAWPDPLDDTEQQLLVAWWKANAERRLVRAWPAVMSIAYELLLHEEASRDRLHALYTEALGAPPATDSPTSLDSTMRHVA